MGEVRRIGLWVCLRRQRGAGTTTGWSGVVETHTCNAYSPLFPGCLFYISSTPVYIISSEAAEQGPCMDIWWNAPPTLILHQICSLVQESNGEGRGKVGHVCRFNEAKKRCMTSLCFLLQQSYSLQKTRLHSPLTYSHRIRHYCRNLFSVVKKGIFFVVDRGRRNES